MIVPATALHAPVLAAIHAGAFPPKEVWGADAFSLQLSLPGVFALLDSDGAMIMARIAADEAEILTLGVLAHLRRQGRARRLLDGAAQQARAGGAGSLFLEVSVHNPAALAAYRAAGFTEVGRRRGYYAPGVDALVMTAPTD